MGSIRSRTAVAIVVAIGLGVFAFLWFTPQNLLLDKHVTEAAPSVPTTPSSGAQAAPSVIASGAFRSLEHHTTGKAALLRTATGDVILRLENLNTSNGPDVRVYLSQIAPSNDLHAYGKRYVDLGGLKGNIGSQNYVIPSGVDLTKFKSAVIWCRRFAVGFGVAPLEA